MVNFFYAPLVYVNDFLLVKVADNFVQSFKKSEILRSFGILGWYLYDM